MIVSYTKKIHFKQVLDYFLIIPLLAKPKTIYCYQFFLLEKKQNKNESPT